MPIVSRGYARPQCLSVCQRKTEGTTEFCGCYVVYIARVLWCSRRKKAVSMDKTYGGQERVIDTNSVGIRATEQLITLINPNLQSRKSLTFKTQPVRFQYLDIAL